MRFCGVWVCAYTIGFNVLVIFPCSTARSIKQQTNFTETVGTKLEENVNDLPKYDPAFGPMMKEGGCIPDDDGFTSYPFGSMSCLEGHEDDRIVATRSLFPLMQ